MGAWLRHCLPETFPDPWSDDHARAIGKMQAAIEGGGTFAFAMPRGHGKTSLCKGGGVLYSILTGKRHWVVAIAAASELAIPILEYAKRQLTENDILAELYPHVCHYFRAIDGKAIKARFQLRKDGKPTGIQYGKDMVIFPRAMSDAGASDYPSDGAIISAAGLTGAIRGRAKDGKGGRIIRPDMAILDDPQTRESAESPSQCDQRERIIMGDVLGLAGPRKKIAAFMPCTVIKRGDLADRFLDREKHPEWQGETCPLVYSWPDAQETLWAQYAEMLRGDLAAGRGADGATAFYVANRAAMDAGARVSWEQRIRDGEVSAIQTAENLLLESGDQFWAEYQNQPREYVSLQYDLDESKILKCQTGFGRLCAPGEAEILVAGADINYSGINWTLTAVRPDAAAWLVAWGKWPERRPLIDKQRGEGITEAQAISGGIVQLATLLNETAVDCGGRVRFPDCLYVDCGFMTETVIGACNSLRLPMRVFPCRGRAADKYRTSKQPMKRGDGWHIAQWDAGPVLVVNADYWREQMQRAFFLTPGSPGSIGLHAGPLGFHKRLVDEILSERLSEHVITATNDFYKWIRTPGTDNDLADALTYTLAGAAAAGADVRNAEGPWRVARAEVETGRTLRNRKPARQCRIAQEV